MTERSEHLIERAAAKLHSSQPIVFSGQVQDAEAATEPHHPDGNPQPVSQGSPGLRTFAPIQRPDRADPLLFNVAAPGQTGLHTFGETVPDGYPGPIPSPGSSVAKSDVYNVLHSAPPSSSFGAQDMGRRYSAEQTAAGIDAASGGTHALQAPAVIHLDALERAGMVVARTTRTRISEEYRIAIGRILRVLQENAKAAGPHNLIMVTSARPGEGKSFTALNLAGSIAQNGSDPVLLVDVDPKVKPLSDQLGIGDVPGFLDLVSDPSLRPEDLVRLTAIHNLAILPVGTRLGGAAQTVGGTASMRPVVPTITRLARRYPKHVVILDAPPCLSTSDPHTIAPHVGQVVLVVEAERTQRTEVEAAVDLVQVCPSITLLLNKVRMTTSHTFGAYDYFGSYT